MNPKEAPFGWLYKRTASQMEQNMNGFLKPYNITSMQSWVLLYLKDRKSCYTFKDLERQFEVSQPTMVGILSRLEQKEFIEVIPDEKDKRIKKVRLSPSGSDLIHRLRQHLNAAEANVVTGFSEEEMAIFHRLLEKAYNNIVERDGEND